MQHDVRARIHSRRIDRSPQISEVEQLARHHERRSDMRKAGALLFRKLEREGNATAIDDLVRNLRGDDLAAQPMAGHARLERLQDCRRERHFKILHEQWIVGQRAFDDRVVQRHLRIGEQHGEFRPFEPAPGKRALCQLLVARQVLDHAVQPPARFKKLDDALKGRQRTAAAALGDRNRLRLHHVVAQHELRNIVGHRFQQRVARGHAHLARSERRLQRDLDVHLVVRTIDTRRIVDEVGVDAAVGPRERDTAFLRNAEVRALADHAHAHLLGIHPHRIIGAVADVCIRFRRRLHVCADAAEPAEIGTALQDRVDQFAGRKRLRVHIQHHLHLGGERDGFLAARENPAAL